MRWEVERVIFELGPLEIRWYGLFFALGIFIGASMMTRSFRERRLPAEHCSQLTIWLVVGMMLGAHLIHLIFYEPSSFIDNPIRIIEIGSGLSSHGGALGTILTMVLFCRIKKVSLFRYMDAAMVGAVWLLPWVRVGNLFNSEIYGRATDVPWAFTFVNNASAGNIPRHPTQLYEALAGFLLIGLAVWLDRRRLITPAADTQGASSIKTEQPRHKDGFLVFLLLGVYFTGRFFVEFFKEYQTLSADIPLTMGQWLSLPFAIVTLGLAIRLRAMPPPREIRVESSEPATKARAKSVRSVRKKGKKKR